VAELILLARAVYQANIRLGNLTSTALKLESPYIMELYQSISSPAVGADATGLFLFWHRIEESKTSQGLWLANNRGFWLCTLYSKHWSCCLLLLITSCCITWEHISEGTSTISRMIAVSLHVLSLKLLNIFQPHLAHQNITSPNHYGCS